MPKDNRKIHSGIRHQGTVYSSGMEDELAEAMNKKQLAAMAEKGAISGDWDLSSATDDVDDVDLKGDSEDDGEDEAQEQEQPKVTAKKSAAKTGSKKAAAKAGARKK